MSRLTPWYTKRELLKRIFHYRGRKIQLQLQFEPRDIWIGVYWEYTPGPYYNYLLEVYVNLLPCLPVRLLLWKRWVQ